MISRRRAIIALPLDAIATMLELPTNLEATHLFPDTTRDALMLRVTGDHLAEVPAGHVPPELPLDADPVLVDTAPVLDALHRLHRQDGPQCSHCWIWDDDAGRPTRAPWPCATMQVAEREALLQPLVVHRLRLAVGGQRESER